MVSNTMIPMTPMAMTVVKGRKYRGAIFFTTKIKGNTASRFSARLPVQNRFRNMQVDPPTSAARTILDDSLLVREVRKAVKRKMMPQESHVDMNTKRALPAASSLVLSTVVRFSSGWPEPENSRVVPAMPMSVNTDPARASSVERTRFIAVRQLQSPPWRCGTRRR